MAGSPGSQPLSLGDFQKWLHQYNKRHLYPSHHLGNYKGFKGSVPGPVMKTEYPWSFNLRGFELHGSTSTWLFSSSKQTVLVNTVRYCEHTFSSLWFLNIFFSLAQWCSASVLQEFLKHATPEYLVRGTDPFSLRLSNKKYYNSQYNSCSPVCMNQHYTCFSCQSCKKYIFGVLQNFSN